MRFVVFADAEGQKVHGALQILLLENVCDADLIAALAAEPAFGMTEAEIKSHMDPANYIGRCPEQVHAFTKKCRALCSSAAVCAEEISL